MGGAVLGASWRGCPQGAAPAQCLVDGSIGQLRGRERERRRQRQGRRGARWAAGGSRSARAGRCLPGGLTGQDWSLARFGRSTGSSPASSSSTSISGRPLYRAARRAVRPRQAPAAMPRRLDRDNALAADAAGAGANSRAASGRVVRARDPSGRAPGSASAAATARSTMCGLRGSGPDGLLINAGQTSIAADAAGGARSSTNMARPTFWWPKCSCAANIPAGRSSRTFTANHGPDHRPITSFTLRVDNSDALDALARCGRPAARPGLSAGAGIERAAHRFAARDPSRMPKPEEAAEAEAGDCSSIRTAAAPTAAATSAATRDFYGAIRDAERRGAQRSRIGACAACPACARPATTSLALGGISVMRVTY